jgi:predicted small secreted protein
VDQASALFAVRSKGSIFRAMKRRLVLPLVLAATVLSACSGVYYNTMEKLGFAKREILVDRVGEAREAQEEAKEQFASALEKFIAVTRVETGDLKNKYDQLNREFARSEQRATEVRDRIAAVDDVSKALFREWKDELKQYSDPGLRRESERQLEQTRDRYEDLMSTMRHAASRMDPILGKFRDQVLFLKHNLNAQAIAGLSVTTRGLQEDISRLIEDMERSIREADAFIKSMQTDR